MRASQSSYIVITLVAVSFMATDVSAQSWLKQFSIRQANKWQAERAIAESIAVANHLPIRVEASDGSVAELQRFVHGIPQYYATDNNLDAARTVATDKVWPGGGFGYTLNGSTDTVGEWDGGAVLTTHQEFGTRVLQTQGTSNLHSTHVAGTMIAAGVNSLAKGMSFQGRLKEWDFNNDVSEMASAAAAGLRTSNHSYGLITGWRFNFFADGRWTWFGDTTISGATDYRFGFYDDEAQTWDNIARNAPYYLMVKAAGNDRGEGPGTQPATHWIYNNNNPQLSSTIRDLDGSGTGYDCLNGASTAKNVLVVGAINAIPGGYTNPSSVVMSSFSSWGPTDDGRIKPDIVADGVNVTSSSTPNNNSYATLSGTSMATPNVTGSVGLLLQHQRNLHGSTLLRASTMRGLIIHTADEAGTNPGPDYVHGWGLMNTLRAVQLMSLDNTEGVGSHMRELTLNQGDTISMTVYSNATQPFRATICWSDPAGTPPTPSLNPSTMMVVNDLDLRIIKQSDQTIYNPWVLDPASPTTAATTGDNIRDNVEQVLIQSPTLGAYTVRITHKGILTSGPQIVSLLMSGNVPSLEARVRVSPTSSTFSINPGASAAESLTIFNDGYIAMTYSSSSGTPWLQITSGSGSVPIQSSSKIYYSLNAASLSQWTTYRDTITIASNDTAHSPTKVPITLNTLGPKIALSPPSFTLEADSGQTTRDSLKIRNTGTVALHFSVSGNDSALPAWISIDKDSSTIPVGDSTYVRITLDAISLSPGDYGVNLRVSNNDSSTGNVLVSVSFHVSNRRTLYTTLESGWNLISLAIDPTSSLKTDLFPTAISNAFGFNGTMYIVKDTLTPGAGYWLKFGSSQTIGFYGSPISQDSVDVLEGWNLVGSLTTPIATDVVSSNPGGIIASNFFGYNRGYVLADSIQPGKGFWVKVNQTGKLFFSTSSASLSKANTWHPPTDFNSLTVTDGRGNSQTLYFSNGESNDGNVSSFVLPPAPPTGSFDVRFASGTFFEELPREGIREYPILIQSPSSRVTVEWKIQIHDPHVYQIMDEAGRSILVNGAGSAILAVGNEHVKVVNLRVQEVRIPKDHVLHQNYPNPFNPSTVIAYDLPKKEYVTLKVFNILGNEVATLVDGTQDPGFKSVTLNAGTLPSGVYFYRLQTEKFSATKTFVLMR